LVDIDRPSTTCWFSRQRAKKNSTRFYDERATARSLCLIDAISDVCRDQDVVLTRNVENHSGGRLSGTASRPIMAR
jgi:hypothetical protein